MHNRSQSVPSYFLSIGPEHLQALKKDVRSDLAVPALLNKDGVSHSITVAYRGSHIRKFPQKSYMISLLNPALFTGEKTIHLNSEYSDPSFIRNKLSLDFFQSIGTVSPRSQFVQLTLNNEFHGVYLQLESVDDVFLKNRGLHSGAIYYAVNDNANFSLISPITRDVKTSLLSGYRRYHGTAEDDGQLRQLIYNINTVPRNEFGAQIVKSVDIASYLRWLTGIVCTQNFDGFIHNYALYYNRTTRLFDILPWDYDATWGRDCHHKIMEYDYIPITGYNTLTARILDVPAFRRQYRLRMEEVLETKFTVPSLLPQIDALHQILRPLVLQDPLKKGKVDQFDAEPEFILQFLRDRNRYLRDHLVDLKYWI